MRHIKDSMLEKAENTDPFLWVISFSNSNVDKKMFGPFKSMNICAYMHTVVWMW